jgi:hypothetical protein
MSTKWIEYTKREVQKPPDDMLSPAEVRERQGQQEGKKIFPCKAPVRYPEGLADLADQFPNI